MTRVELAYKGSIIVDTPLRRRSRCRYRVQIDSIVDTSRSQTLLKTPSDHRKSTNKSPSGSGPSRARTCLPEPHLIFPQTHHSQTVNSLMRIDLSAHSVLAINSILLVALLCPTITGHLKRSLMAFETCEWLHLISSLMR
jgi:hypothetical protein